MLNRNPQPQTGIVRRAKQLVGSGTGDERPLKHFNICLTVQLKEYNAVSATFATQVHILKVEAPLSSETSIESTDFMPLYPRRENAS
jgi:hypothetical protein